MATLLRPPLVFDRRQKLPIGTPDSYPNLIASTLRNDVLTLTQPCFSIRLSESAPPRTREVRFYETPNLLTSTLFQTTQLAAPLGPQQWDDSAPTSRAQVRVDLYPNLLGTTLGAPVTPLALPLNAIRNDWPAPWRKTQVYLDLYPSLGQNTLAPAAAPLDPPLLFRQLSDSAPWRGRVLQVDQPPRPVWMDPVPQMQRLDQSAPPRKLQTRIDTTPNPVVLLQPLIRGWFESAPPRVKARVMVDMYPSLNTTGLVPPASLTKPLGNPYDFSTPQRKYAIEFDLTPNMLVRGISTTSILETIPYLIGAEEYSARIMLGSIYMVVVVIGTGGTVTAQSVAPFTQVVRGTTVTITMGGPVYTPSRGGGNIPYNLH